MHRGFKTRTETGALASLLLCVAFASLVTFIQTLESWVPQWKAEPGQPASITIRLPSSYFRVTLRRAQVEYLSTRSSTCPNLVARGETVREGECGLVVKAFEKTRYPVRLGRIAGFFAINLFVSVLLLLFLRKFGTYRARLAGTHVVTLSLILLVLGAAKAYFILTPWPAYFFPVAVVPILSAYFLKRRVALVFNLVSAFWVVSLINFDVQAFGIFLAQSIGAYLVPERRQRPVSVLNAGFVSGWVALLMTIVTTLLFAGHLHVYDDWSEHWDPRYSIWIASLGGGVIAGVFSWILLPLLGRLLGELSRSQLLDLQDLDHPLLARLREAAPGTWEHSRSEANLAEAAAAAIGANAQLVRVGAYFHDIGKMMNPQFFIENKGDNPNPHDDMEPLDSAEAIIGHVTDGVRILRTARIPEAVVDFVYTHHGDGLIEFFWAKNMKAGNPGQYSEKDFSHRGMKPFTRETGILMLVDAIEAGSRTVEKHEKSRFEHMVQAILFSKLSQGQIDASGLTVEDLKEISKTLVDALVSIYHARIKYPWQTEEDIDSGNTSKRLRTNGALVSVSNGPDSPKPAQPSVPAPSVPAAPAEPQAQPGSGRFKTPPLGLPAPGAPGKPPNGK